MRRSSSLAASSATDTAVLSSTQASKPASLAAPGGVLEIREGDVHVVWTFTDKVQKSVGLWQLFRERFLPPEELAELGGHQQGGTGPSAKPATKTSMHQEAQQTPSVKHHHQQQQQQQQQPQHSVHEQMRGEDERGNDATSWSHHDERMLARALTRSTLAAAINGMGRGPPVDPKDLCFVRNGHGKPFLAHPWAAPTVFSAGPFVLSSSLAAASAQSAASSPKSSLVLQQQQMQHEDLHLHHHQQGYHHHHHQQQHGTFHDHHHHQDHHEHRQQQQGWTQGFDRQRGLWSPDLGSGALGRPPLQFNTTHTRGAVGCAVASGSVAIGFDMEQLGRVPKGGKLMSLARRRFAPAECAALEACANDPAQQARLFSCLWSLKEAALKARGTGISAPPGLKGFAMGLYDATAVSRSTSSSHAQNRGDVAAASVATEQQLDIDFSGALRQLCPGLEESKRNGDGKDNEHCEEDGTRAGGDWRSGSDKSSRGAACDAPFFHITMECGDGGHGVQQAQHGAQQAQGGPFAYHFLLLHLSSQHVAALCVVVPPHMSWPGPGLSRSMPSFSAPSPSTSFNTPGAPCMPPGDSSAKAQQQQQQHHHHQNNYNNQFQQQEQLHNSQHHQQQQRNPMRVFFWEDGPVSANSPGRCALKVNLKHNRSRSHSSTLACDLHDAPKLRWRGGCASEQADGKSEGTLLGRQGTQWLGDDIYGSDGSGIMGAGGCETLEVDGHAVTLVGCSFAES